MAAKAAESRKHENNDKKGSELGWQYTFSYIAMQEAILTNCSKSQVLGDLYGRLSIILVQANARAILARSLQVTADIETIGYLYNHFVCIYSPFPY